MKLGRNFALQRSFVPDSIWMEGELPSVQNNVTFQVAAKPTTFEKLDCFRKMQEKCESQSIWFSELREVHLLWL